MAVDTRNKRASCLNIGTFNMVLPHPNGVIDQGDRFQTTFSYRGLMDAVFEATLWFSCIF